MMDAWQRVSLQHTASCRCHAGLLQLVSALGPGV
jgi:hypothetical protein